MPLLDFAYKSICTQVSHFEVVRSYPLCSPADLIPTPHDALQAASMFALNDYLLAEIRCKMAFNNDNCKLSIINFQPNFELGDFVMAHIRPQLGKNSLKKLHGL